MTETNATGKGKCRLVKNEDFPAQVREVIKSTVNPETGSCFTVKEVAEAIGISMSSLNMQLGNNPTTNMLRSIARVLDCDMVDFFRAEATHATDTHVTSRELADVAGQLRAIADRLAAAGGQD